MRYLSLQLLVLRLELDDLRLPCLYSVGIAVYPDDGRQPDELLQCADERMYEEKKRRRVEDAPGDLLAQEG